MADLVIDDVQRHLNHPNYPMNSGADHAAIRVGFYLAWASERGLIAPELKASHSDQFIALGLRRTTGPLMIRAFGGELRASMLTDEAIRFSKIYCAKSGRYISDFIHTFVHEVAKAKSMYCIPDTNENQSRFAQTLSDRFDAWQQYAPAAESIFDPQEVGHGVVNDLEEVTQLCLITAVRALAASEECSRFVVFRKFDRKLCVPTVLKYRNQKMLVATESGFEAAKASLDESMLAGAIPAYAVGCVRSRGASGLNTGQRELEIVAKQHRCGAHRVVTSLMPNSAGILTLGIPKKLQ